MNAIWDEILGQETRSKNESNKLDSEISLDQIPSIELSEFANEDLALQIYSKVLDCEVWLCSSVEMANQVKNDDPVSITYTTDEIKHLIKLSPSPDDLRRINDVKEVFNGSKIIEGINHNK